MRNKPQMLSRQCLSNFAWLALALPAAIASATGGIATDGTMGAELTLSGANVTIPQGLGTTAGNNLFHSFAEFNIASGQTVEFTGSDALQNVISRVTGPEATAIDGTLKSSIGNAAFYFINPNGITFGTYAQIDVPGAFHIGTADKIDFPNGAVLFADGNRTGTLSSEAPSAFGFIATSTANNGLIHINGAGLNSKAGQTLDIAAGEITIENGAVLRAPAGEIRLLAMPGVGSVSLQQSADNNLPLPEANPSTPHAGRITINAGTVDTAGDGGGRITLLGKNTSLTNSTIRTDNLGTKNTTSMEGVDIHSFSLKIDNSTVSSDTLGAGNAGNVTLETTGSLEIVNGGRIQSNTYAEGDTGDMMIKSQKLSIDNQNFWSSETGIFVQAEYGSSGQAGNVNIQAGTLDIFAGGKISSSTHAKGDAGSVNVTANNLTINGGLLPVWTGIFTQAQQNSNGQAGNVFLKAEKLNILDYGNVSSSTYTQAQAGNISVQAGTLNILRGGGVTSSTFYDKGNAGNITVMADNLKIDGLGIGSSSLTGIFSEAELYSRGNAGNVTIQAETLDINDGWISSSTWSQGNAGNVIIQSKTLDILNGGEISSFSNAQNGNAGNITVTTDTLRIDDQNELSETTGIFSNTHSKGHAGNLSIQAGRVDILNGGEVSSSTTAQGNAGNITVTADTLRVNGQGNLYWRTGIFSETNGNGHAGNLTIEAGRMDILNGGEVSSSTDSLGDAGSVTVTADTLAIEGPNNLYSSTGIFSATTWRGQAGNVFLQAGRLDILNGGQVSSSTRAQGDAGSVTVKADTVTIDSLNFSSWAAGIVSAAESGSSGRAGNVTVTAGTLSLNNLAHISSDTYSGRAGTVRVNAGTAAILGGSDISSASRGTDSSGRTGNVIVSASHWLHLADGGRISIENQANLSAADANDSSPGRIVITAPVISMENSEITSASSGNVAAGNIIVNFSHWLTMDSSFISTTANTGDGGTIAINGGELINLRNSGFKSTVHGTNSDGGNITANGDLLVMNTGLIQANAVGGSGGNIKLNIEALIPCCNMLILGGASVRWQAFMPGFNVIQAASSKGVSGNLSVTAPQLNLSGVLANLGGPQFDTNIINQDDCDLDYRASSLTRGTGGLKPASSDQMF